MVALVVVLPIVALTTSAAASNWVNRVTPNAGLAIQQTLDLPDVVIGPWAGLGVLAAYAAVALGDRRLAAAEPGRMRRAVRAEWTKLRTVPSTAWSLVALVGLTVGLGRAGEPGPTAPGTAATRSCSASPGSTLDSSPPS